MYWTLDDDRYNMFESRIASYISPGTVFSIIVEEPWKSRGWNVDTTNGELAIPEVLLSDEDVYYCGGTENLHRVILSVHGEL